MGFELVIFLVLVFVSFINQGVQMYIHFEAYPLLASVGKAEFSAYIQSYEQRLNIPLLLPYALTLLANLILIFVRPAALSMIVVIVLFVLNLAVAMVTMRVATPVYEKIKASGDAKGADMAQLMQINLLRLALTSASSVVVLYLLWTVLSL